MQYHELEIERVVEETADTRSYVLRIPPELAARFAYKAGQFLTFKVVVDGKDLIRCYSLASSPDVEREHKVTVKRVDRGRVSNFFNDQLKAGARVAVLPPSGRFVLRESEAPLLLFGGGSGITPLVAIVKTALATTRRRIRLFYANRDPGSVIFAAELAALAERHADRFELIHHLDSEAGFADAARIGRAVDGFETAHAYVCGPGPFMDVVEGVLGARGFEPARVHIERFESPADGEAPRVVLSADAEVPERLRVHLAGQVHDIPYRKGQSILQAVQEAGLEAPFACEEGYCGSCAARRIQGQVVMANNDVFDPDEVEAGHILTCQGRALGPVCEIAYEG